MTLFTMLMLALAFGMAFFYAPTERSMGEVQRIFYFHVGSFWTAFAAFFLNAVGSVAYLASRREWWDALAGSAAEVGAVFCSAGLAMGPLWAKPVWGIWWTWDPRLTLALLLWLLYIAYVLLRGFLPECRRRALVSSVFGIFAVADVPLVYMANRWWRTQHPQPVIAGGPQSGLEAHMWITLFVCWGALLALMISYLRVRLPMEMARWKLEAVRRELRAEGLADFEGIRRMS